LYQLYDFELNIDNDWSTDVRIGISNDQLIGGAGDDILFGQDQNDVVDGSAGADTLFGGSGTNVLTSDALDLDIRDGSDNRPKLESLDILKKHVFTAMSASANDIDDSADQQSPWVQQLATDMMSDDTLSTVNALPFDRMAGNFVVTDEDIDLTAYRSYTNPANKLDVNNDGHVSPLDVLWIINELNAQGAQSLPTMRGLGTKAVIFVDPTADGQLSSLDALLVINELNDRTSGESEFQPRGSRLQDARAGALVIRQVHSPIQPSKSSPVNVLQGNSSEGQVTPWVNRPEFQSRTQDGRDGMPSLEVGQLVPCIEADFLFSELL
jgi:hypothetical protein